MSQDNENFMDAVKGGDVNLVKSIIDSTANVSCRDEVQSTALHYACACGHTELVQYLLDYGADVDAVNDFNESPLHNASSKGHMEIVQMLLNKNANKDIQTDDGWTALHLAAEKGHPEVVKLLVRRGANVSIKDKGGAAAAGYASKPEIIEEIAAVTPLSEDTLKSPAPVHLVGTAEPCEVATVAEQAVVEPEPLTTQYQAVPQVEEPEEAAGTGAPQQQHDTVILETISLEDEDQELSVKGAPSDAATAAASVQATQCCAIM